MRIVGQSAELQVIVEGREREHASISEDSEWLRATVHIIVAGFSGAYNAAFMVSDFAQFSEQLAAVVQSLRGTAAFRTLEDSLSIDIAIGRTGAAQIRGVARTSGLPTATLSFVFESDLFQLGAAVQGLQRIVATFPVLHDPG